MKLRVVFLNKCIKSNIVLPHLNKFKTYHKNLFHELSCKKFDMIFIRFVKSMIRNEIYDVYKHIRYLRAFDYKYTRTIAQILPLAQCNKFFYTQNRSLHFHFMSESDRLDKKFNWLLCKQNKNNVKKLKTINYFCKFPSRTVLEPIHNREILEEFSIKPFIRPNNSNAINISLDPSIFQPTPASPLDIKSSWFTNLTNIQIPEEVQGLLQLGENFCLPTNNKQKIVTEFVKSVDHNTNKLSVNSRIRFRNRITPIINNLANFSVKASPLDRKLTNAYLATNSFIKEHPYISFTRADKGNVTVAINKDEYILKMNEILSDEKTYIKVSKDPTKKLIRDLHSLLMKWKKCEYITELTYKRLNCTDGVLPRAYGLPKIHKSGNPLRIIVSSMNTPLYELASFLHDTINDSIPIPKSNLNNSFQLVEQLKYFNFPNDFKLISLDVVSMFTNIPLDLARDSVRKRWKFIEKKCKIPCEEFLYAIDFVLSSSFFMFEKVTYRQTFGTPMGSPLSPIIANITLQDLERSAVEILPFTLPFYYRYVDDILMAAPSCMFDTILKIFNSFHERLQFTMEEGVDNKINFLDTTIIVKDNNIIFDWFHKPTYSGRYLNFESRHPLCQKRGTVISLIDRAFRLSHPIFHQKNLEFVVCILLRNGYPLSFIFSILAERIKTLIFSGDNDKNTETNITDTHTKFFFNIPYVPNFSEQFLPVVRDLQMKLSYTGLNKMNKLIHPLKDQLQKELHNNVVYKISCNDCDASYVGQTSRLLKTRIAEHRNHISRNTNQHSVITDHRLTNHEFAWDEVEILDEERIYGKRLVSEMIFIKRQTNSLNLQSDTEGLHHAYFNILENLPKI